MGFWTGLYLMSFLNMACCLPESSYTVHLNKLSFDSAQNHCQPGSFLTNILNEKEMTKILQTIWDKNNKTATSFWIGLKKDKGVCLEKKLPLKGFYWTMDNSTESDLNMWKTDPSDTCTQARCVLLLVVYGDSSATRFVDTACKRENPFICKRNVEMACTRPEILGTHDITQHLDDPYTCKIDCGSGASFTLTCSKDLVWTLVGNEDLDISQLCLECDKGYRRDASGHCEDVNECDESKPCLDSYECLNTKGSYKCVCFGNNSNDCDGPKLPTTYVNSKDYSNRGKFATTQPTSLPDDVITNKTDVHVEESAGDISNIIVPVIIALLIFIVLLVIVAAIVKGCLRKRSMKLARRKAEAVALNGSSSMEKVNEREET